jgi:uncharacterized protein (TIGR02246 family)
MPRLVPRLRLAAVCVLLALPVASCRTPATAGVPSPESAAETRATLLRLMGESRDAWNRADLAGHVALYTDSATMMSGQGPRGGRDVIRGMLERGFWAGGRPKAQLEFSDLAVTPLGADHAMMTGACKLTNPDGSTSSTCRFTLVWVRENGQWKIMHDHSS